ncbi:peptidoglycan-binding domain-containing protein [Alkalibacter saccharofermentans]|uniref:Peptidoglycan-binding (PGRP) domain of peptidoglycan hydrolases-containing protein n=1 Tax=Alkalibacter saccharofermentans DSM 14828 TaxID=1120975 RepID=A0A1M4X1F2_9FIRM|nr:peptidoglycan-binding protein [Alkalibacter saccharofermentans]SHE87328.1 Peptidoglycan-binding (PGRP) domain of peptidoglycan hydrolases-containing protein [Alkalibacter saccharofermentans DSM 14828]
MKSFKGIFLYCVILVFLLSLSASFEGMNIIENRLTGLSLSSDQMKLAFYDRYSLMEQLGDDGRSGNSDIGSDIEEGVEYTIGSSEDQVYEFQLILYYLDYLDEFPNGKFQETTKDAVSAYQGDKGFKATGVLDFETMTALQNEEIIYSLGKEGKEILRYQMILYYMDYLTQYPNGSFGEETASSVVRYQRDKGLEANGELDKVTRDSLFAESITYKVGKRGDAIKALQERLISLGYLDGQADGQYGNMTAQGVTRFQQENDLEETGNLDPETIARINQLSE